MRRVALLALFAAPWARGAENRLTLLNQSDWERKTGVYLNFENKGVAPLRLGEVRLILGVGDGKAWRFLAAAKTFETGHSYRIEAEVTATGARLLVDGQLVAGAKGAYQPFASPALANDVPSWASDPTDYEIVLTRLQVKTGTVNAARDFPGTAPGARLFSGSTSAELTTAPLRPNLRIVADVRIDPAADLASLAPLVDRYGQARFLDWPGKAKDDESLRKQHEEEVAQLDALAKDLPATDKYGGRLGAWSEKASGFFRVVKREGKWHLVSPEGHPLFYTGVCTAPGLFWDQTPVTGRESYFAEIPPKNGTRLWGQDVWGDTGVAYFAPQAPWLRRRDGTQWEEKNKADALRRLRALGFTGYGKWCEGEGRAPEFPVLSPAFETGGLAHVDPFDPDAKTKGEAAVAAALAPRRNDPTVVGWTIGNEYDELIKKSEIVALLARTEPSAAKRELLASTLTGRYGGDKAKFATAYGGYPEQLNRQAVVAPDADVEPMRVKYEDAYFAFLHSALKKADPDHLDFGVWIVPGWWESPADWDLAAKYVDVIGYDRYALDFADESVRALFAKNDKPVLCGEFSFPPTYEGARGYGRYFVSVRDEEEAGRRYAAYASAAAADPRCVGTLWFQYRDQPVLGRGENGGDRGAPVRGEHYAFGIVDATDRLKWPLARAMREANLGTFGIPKS